MVDMHTFRVNPNDPLPRYYQVYTSLLARIGAGEFAPGTSLPAERQLAEDYGVSRITVIKALDLLAQKQLIQRQHGRGTFVSSAQEAKEAERQYSIAFVIDGLPASYSLSLLIGVAREMERHHYALQIVTLYGSSDEEARQIYQLAAQGVDGIIVFPQSGYRNEALYHKLRMREFPVVMIDRYYPQVDTDRVVFDDVQAGYSLTCELLDRGYTRIAVVPYTEIETTSVLNRLQGYRLALEERGIAYNEDLFWVDVYASLREHTLPTTDSYTSQAVLRRRLERNAPSAFFVVNREAGTQLLYDLLMINTERMRVALAQGSATSEEYSPALAAIVDQPLNLSLPAGGIVALQSGEALGSEAARLMIGRLSGTIHGGPRAISLPMQIEQWQITETLKEAAAIR